MRTTLLGVASLILLPAAGLAAAAEDSKQPADAAAGRLVAEALRCELAGHNAERQRLLAEATQQQPNFAPARWQAGYLRLNDKWLPVDEVARAAAVDPVRQEYVNLRRQCKDDVAGQLRLGVWCQGHKLTQEARAHLLRVIALDPDNAHAWSRLGYKRYRGLWLTDDQVAQCQAAAQRLRQADARWKPRIVSIRQRLDQKSEAIKQRATDELLAIRDVEAIYPLGRHLAGTSSDADELLAKMLGEIPDQRATVALAQLSVLSPWPGARTSAAVRLKARDWESCASVLLASMGSGPTSIALCYIAPGNFLLRQTVSHEGQDSSEPSVRDMYIYRPALANPPINSPIFVTSWASAFLISHQVGTHDRPLVSREEFDRLPKMGPLETAFMLQGVEYYAPDESFSGALTRNNMKGPYERVAYTLNMMELNERVAYTLNTVTNQQLAPDPNVWQKWWSDRNGMAAKAVHPTKYKSAYVSFCSCFAAGTSAWTITGPRPIEKVHIGDLVLSQNPDTGELAYKPVLRTTVRPAMQLVKLTAGDETFQCTPGHPFWVDGTGWVMAKELAPGLYFHGRQGAVPLWERAKGDNVKTYNLVVADFNTYFIGRERILVHDNSIFQPAEGTVPGLGR